MSDAFLMPLLRGRKVSLQDALERDINMLDQLKWPADMLDFCSELYYSLDEIKEIGSRHLRIPASDFQIADFEHWLHGSYNTCVPVDIKGHLHLPRRVLIRFPQPFKVGESFRPGNAEEKLRCEAATYIWLRKECPTIPIPRLLAVVFPGTQSLTAIELESWWNRLLWRLRQFWTGRQLIPYFSHRRGALRKTGYLILEHIEQGEMLSRTWQEHRHDPNRRANLFSGLAQVLLSLAKQPLPKIGSWTIDNHGNISLTNRPLIILAHEFESHSIPTGMPRNRTYSSADSWIIDLLACHDSRMRHQPNAIHDTEDGITQLSALTGLRALMRTMIDHRDQGAPFVMSLTDLHASNIFVDDNWNITCIIDLEFACTMPIEMTMVPEWLTNRGIDQLDGAHYEEYGKLYDEFVTALEQLQRRQHVRVLDDIPCSQMLRKAWETGSFWYFNALFSVNAFPALFHSHMLRHLGSTWTSDIETAFMKCWCPDAPSFIEQKLEQQKTYEQQIRDLFSTAAQESAGTTTGND